MVEREKRQQTARITRPRPRAHSRDVFALALLEDEPAELIREVEHIRARFGEETDGATLSVGICDGATVRRAPGHPSSAPGSGRRIDGRKKQGPRHAG